MTEPTRLTALSDPTSVEFELVDERPGFSEAEAYAFLAGADTSVFSVPPIVVAAAEVHTGAMIALIPSDDHLRRLAVAGGEPRDQLHTTLVYLGEADDISPNAKRQIVERVEFVASNRGPIAAEGFALSVFNPPGHVKDDGKDRDACIVLGVSGSELDVVHTLTLVAVSEVIGKGFTLPEQHRPWIPHITLTYTDDVSRVQELTDRVGPVVYDRIRVAFAGDVHDVPLVS